MRPATVSASALALKVDVISPTHFLTLTLSPDASPNTNSDHVLEGRFLDRRQAMIVTLTFQR